VVEWVPSGILFPQALVFMVRQRDGLLAAAAVRVATFTRKAVNRIKRVLRDR
jgi:hypothetical protein